MVKVKLRALCAALPPLDSWHHIHTFKYTNFSIKYRAFQLQEFENGSDLVIHTIYTRNNMGQKCEGNCGLWVLNKVLKKMYPEILKKIVGAIWEIPAK